METTTEFNYLDTKELLESANKTIKKLLTGIINAVPRETLIKILKKKKMIQRDWEQKGEKYILVKQDRLVINKIIENSLPLMIKNKRFTQECADAILLYFVENSHQETAETPIERQPATVSTSEESVDKEEKCQ